MAQKNNSPLITAKSNIMHMNVIDSDGKNLGKMSKEEALSIAERDELDLVLFSFKDNQAFVKILDYGKFKFEQGKKKKQNARNQTITKKKEIKVKPLIGDHDLQIRAKNTLRWLDEGNRVSFVIVARGRISSKPELVDIVYNKFIELIGDKGIIQISKKKVSNTRYETLIVPKK